MRDLRELIGDEVDPAELERLERVHELLGRVGPPPELSPTLASPPEPPPARVVPFPRRYRYTAAVAAAAAAVTIFGIGYLAGGATRETPERTIAMQGSGGASARLDLFARDAAGNWPMKLEARNLSAGAYELWLTRDGELAEPCGSFLVTGATTRVPLNAPYRLRQFDGWVVVRSGSEVPVLST